MNPVNSKPNLLGRLVRDIETGMVGTITDWWDDGRLRATVVWDQPACVLGEDVELVDPGECGMMACSGLCARQP